MVGFNPQHRVHLSHREHAVAGAISGAVARALFQPLDVLKIRFQLQVEPLKKEVNPKYFSIQQAVRRIAAEEGVQALWKGHNPAQILSVVFGVVQYTTFELLTKEFWLYLPEKLTTEWKPVTHTVCGALAGCASTVAIQPIDVIRTRFVAQGEPKIYTSILSAGSAMIRKEGFGSLYKGLIPAMTQIGPQMGLQMGFYAAFTDMWNRTFSIFEEKPPGVVESLVCGSGSGIACKTAIYPFDMIKKRLQVQGFEEARKHFGQTRVYKGMVDCFVTVLREEGLRGLFKGLSPSILKAATVSGCTLSTYDQICRIMMLRHR